MENLAWSQNSMEFCCSRVQNYIALHTHINTLRPRQNGRNFPDDIFKCISLNENASISINISPKSVPNSQNNNTPALVQIMAWRQPGDKPLSEQMMVRLQMHLCVTQPQWVNNTGRVLIVRRAGLLWSQQDFEWLWSVPLSRASLY